MRKIVMILGFGLLFLWVVGLNSPEAVVGLAWFDGLAALAAFSLAGGVYQKAARSFVSGSVILSIGLFALWGMGLLFRGAPFQNWWAFIFACAFGILAIVADRRSIVSESRAHLGESSRNTEEKDQFKKSA